jgi:hypothetical protein
MSLKFFIVPVLDSPVFKDELNGFLASHQVLSMDRRLVDKSVNSFWGFRQPPAEPANGNPHTRDRLTARESFNDSERWTTTILNSTRKKSL